MDFDEVLGLLTGSGLIFSDEILYERLNGFDMEKFVS